MGLVRLGAGAPGPIRAVGVDELAPSQPRAGAPPVASAGFSGMQAFTPERTAPAVDEQAEARALMVAGGASATTIANVLENLRTRQVTMDAVRAQFTQKPAPPSSPPLLPPSSDGVGMPMFAGRRPVLIATEIEPDRRGGLPIAEAPMPLAPSRVSSPPVFRPTKVFDSPFSSASHQVQIVATVRPTPALGAREPIQIERESVVPTGDTAHVSTPVNIARPSGMMGLVIRTPPGIMRTREWTDPRGTRSTSATVQEPAPLGEPAPAPADGGNNTRLFVAAGVLAALALGFAVYRS